MNNDRRKRINAVMDDLNKASTEINQLHADVVEALDKLNARVQEVKDEVVSQIEEIRDEEQEAFDNMSENLQGGEKGELIQEAVNNLDSALNELENLEDIEEPALPALTDIIGYLESAVA